MDERSQPSFSSTDTTNSTSNNQSQQQQQYPTQTHTHNKDDSPVLPSGSHFPAQAGEGGEFIPSASLNFAAPTSTNPNNFGLGVSNTQSADTTNANTNISSDVSTGSTLSPLPSSLPLSSSPSLPHLLGHRIVNAQQIGQSNSPQIPPAPVHGTIPLPHVEDCDHNSDGRSSAFSDRRQFHQYQPGIPHHSHGQGLAPGSAIELADLTIREDNASGNGQQQALGVSHSQSQALSSPSEFGITPSSTTSSGFDLSSYTTGTSTVATTPALSCSIRSPSLDIPASSSDPELSVADAHKTPNVYINGLPPHFPEDQLFALASPFGEIRSVRTFTRHVRDSESGYGFVLFETIDAAEKCIISLRRYRNLHPTFSKQIHKIPGTTYAQAAIPPSGSSTCSWDEPGGSINDGAGGSVTDSAGVDASLPLSIDEPTLAALVSPHRISSSRFFQTRLSNPPRIIAFVRLETRPGAEEVIERLHGRMVRGWNDAGSRISVRFADTSEQRELRLQYQRTERSALEGSDGSPVRLTIAQAALLNLRGQDLRPPKAGPVIHAHAGGVAARVPSTGRGFGPSVSMPDFASNSHFGDPLAHGGAESGLEVDYSLAPGRNHSSGMAHGRNRSPLPYRGQQDHTMPSSLAHELGHGPTHIGHVPAPAMDPAMVALLDSLRSSGAPYRSNYPHGSAGGSVEYMQQPQRSMSHQQQHQPRMVHPQYHGALAASQSMSEMPYARPGPAYTRSGYTATEEYIMRAHAESAALAQAQAQHHHQQHVVERRRPAPLDLRRHRGGEEMPHDEPIVANIAMGVRGYRAQASIGRVGQDMMSPPTTASSMGSMMSGGMGSGMTEEDFHASAAAVRSEFRQQLRTLADGAGGERDGVGNRAVQNPARHNSNIHPAHVNARLSREPSAQYQQQPQQVQRPLPLSPLMPSTSNNESSPNLNDLANYQHAAAHLRSTTLPQHRPSAIRDGHQQQHLMHRAKGHFQHSSMSIPPQTLRTPQHANASVMGGNSGIDTGSGGGVIYENDLQQQHHHSINATNNVNPQSNATKGHQYSNIYGDDGSSSSPSLISPSLTYSSQSPSTLSPATPFFGSFNNQSESFDKGGAGMVHGMDQQHQKKPSTTLRSGSR
ncbi:hypothetical protein B0H34DRAFT_798438 [Crassisporium funariophilum]|nr:hypothetical protein B0H34DRAFT_798438 [Crassisporium funariophilum]